MSEQPTLNFAGLLRQLRGQARLTQEELAEAAGLSLRAVSDLERGIHRTAHRDTAVLLADALGLAGGSRELFVAAARGRGDAERVLAAKADTAAAAAAGARPGEGGPGIAPVLTGELPAQLSSFVGRRIELAEVCGLVATCRLVTLTGSGGVGKTRLGLQVAAGLAEGAGEGVWFVDLAPLSDSDLVAATVAHVLGIREDAGRPATATLIDAVGTRRLLVVLDNCEHVIDACAKLADALLRGCPNLALMATSREPLGIGGERVYRVPSMAVPDEGEDAAAIWVSEAVRLLEDRAAAQGVALGCDGAPADPVGRICRRLDGIPLALELAAARLRVMPVAELEARLDERFSLLTGGSRAALPRQQTLRAMVEWSWELLTGPERAVLARLSVFAGGFTLAAAEAVAADQQVPPGEIVGHLGALVDKSLVQFGDTGAGPSRYRLLETFRQYAAAQLDAWGTAASSNARIAHRDYYLALAEAAVPQLVAADQAAWLDRLDAELGNLRVAITVSQALPGPEPGLRLAASLREFWKARGHAAEGARVLQAFLDAPAAQEATLARGRALAAAAYLLALMGGYAVAWDYCEEALVIARGAGDEYLITDLLYEQAFVLLHRGRLDAALSAIESGLSLCRRLGEPHQAGRLLSARSYAMYMAGDLAGAARDTAEALELFRQTRDRIHAGEQLNNLGNNELSAGDLDAARRHLAEAVDIFRALNARSDLVFGTFNLGLAEYLGGSPDAAGDLFAESLDLGRRIGMKANMAYALLGLAMAGRGQADPRWSARLHGAADQALTALGEPREPLEERLAGLDRQRLRAALGTEAFEAEYATGRALTPEESLVLALGELR